ncbi:hypothetical protein OB955_20255 [Halobacteria archaeon AArc-m2/3/4]|uniref:Uncharacterized protein n=1 Tax=Natronoglomus mannanivorans TaxID=2979990 RepID=A0ABT2QJD5_9EURY|nr:hypothetical protein [Halobacteria archaeon AArc-m2/3/4]
MIDDLDENETATLWSKEPNECDIDENETAIRSLPECTDITFKEPPETASLWTTSAFDSLAAGSSNTSVYPEHADRTDSGMIEDAHATIFAVQPSTWVHQDENTTALYTAPDGELRGLVDYRVRVPANENTSHRTIEWSLLEHEVSEIRLKQDGDVLVEQDGEQTPVIDYNLAGAGESNLTLEADIEARLEENITRETVGSSYSEYHTDTVTVSSEIDLRVYNLTASVYHAEYPDGGAGVAIYQSQPWHGYTLTEEGDAAVRGVWRYYTARDTDWDTLVRSTGSGEDAVESEVRPVYVRAFPSEMGPRADPIRDGPSIEEVWGSESSSPNPTFHENVEVDVIDEPYTRSYGLAIQYDDLEREHLEVQGIVHDTNADLVEPENGSSREIRESELSVEILEQNDSTATVRINLRDAETGDPIPLEYPFTADPRTAPIGHATTRGYLTVNEQPLWTNSSGVAVATLREPGSYTIEYHPAPWRTHDPAYLGDRTSLGWHPLATASGWLSLLVQVFWISIPFLVALYAGLKLGSFLEVNEEAYP